MVTAHGVCLLLWIGKKFTGFMRGDKVRVRRFMQFEEFEQEQRFREAWSAVEIVRPVHYALFTFGESVLPYSLVCGESPGPGPVTLTRGEVRVARPMIITPENSRPEFRNFFENQQEKGVVEFLLARTAHFSSLKFDNQSGSKQVVHDGMQTVVDRLNQQLDEEEEDHVAILTAPPNLAGIAVLRYAAERVWKSGPDNVQELRERGFLP